jgi:nucleoside-diphosphate-sugar epimerase
MTPLRVVVVGATGNVGTSVVRALVADPAVASVVGVARRAPATWPASPKVTWRSADIVTDALAPVFEGADAVVHLGWLIQPSRQEAVTHAVNVDGSARVFAAAAQAGVGALVYASSVGAYSPGPKDRAMDETWPTDGVQTSFYSRHKAQVERGLDRFERAHPDVRVVRLRPGLIFKREAASEIRRYFLGPLLPSPLVRRKLIPVVPDLPGLRFQAVHADDVADAYRLAVVRDVAGAFNVAADPVLDPAVLGDLLGARPLRVAPKVLRALADVTWKLRLQPTPPGWLDMALAVPIMDTTRAREELGWAPRSRSTEALGELLEGLRLGDGGPTPPLDAAAAGPLRLREFATGVGARAR